MVTAGSGISAMSVSRQSIASMTETAITKPSAVLAKYMTAGPTIMRTALRSLVARDMRSPVRLAWKYASGRRSRCAKKSFRRSYSICRDAPISQVRIR